MHQRLEAIISPTLITKILLNMIKHGSVEISEADYPVGSKKTAKSSEMCTHLMLTRCNQFSVIVSSSP